MDITVDKLHAQHKKKKDKTKEIYRGFLEKCFGRIQNRNELGYQSMCYTIPPFSLGTPLYDYTKAVGYVKVKLTSKGFKVNSRDNVLYIDWTPRVNPKKERTSKDNEEPKRKQHRGSEGRVHQTVAQRFGRTDI
jgi:hypothetical protein